MNDLADKSVLVIGLGKSGLAAAHFLQKAGARVTAVDSSSSESLEKQADQLRAIGVEVQLRAQTAPTGQFDLGVLSPGVPPTLPLVKQVRESGLHVISEMELGYQHSKCLNISITGTNGKTTTTELVERVLTHCQKRTVAAGNIGTPLTAVVEQTKELDLVTLEVSSFQLEAIQYFRPSIAVLMNITPDHLDRYSGMEDYARAKAKIFENQQVFDWAIVQSEALAQLKAIGVKIPSKVITFSAADENADIYLDRGLIISRLPNWNGPLLNMEECRLMGPHNAENLMATLAVSRVLRLPLEEVLKSLKSYVPAPHRCEVVAAINGVRYVNDSKATNPDAVDKALQTMPGGKTSDKNVFLIAGGRDKGFEYHSVGPQLSKRVKHAFLIGETREKLRASWSLFTPCTLTNSLLEAVVEAAKQAASGDIVLLSPACSSFDMFQNYQHRGDVFRQAVEHVERTMAGSGTECRPISGSGEKE
ncbi:MAG TPA: UDP-N-acetylmuramoyl-L-alanine--D-glutamate ligase [Verrucomicrobiae bacterium]